MTYADFPDPDSGLSGDPGKRPEVVKLMGASIAKVTEAEAVELILEAAEKKTGHWTVTANLDHLRRYSKLPTQRRLIDEADMVVADGMPLIWASRVAGTPLPERVSGSRMVWSISEAVARRGYSLYLLGGDPGVAARAAAVLQGRYAGLRIAGTAWPAPGFEHDEQQLGRIVDAAEAVAPDIVFVALGFPKQDLLIRRLREVLPRASYLGVGISFSYVTGDLAQPPDWVCLAGLEWAYRLSQEPTLRLLDRYLVKGFSFAPLVLLDVMRKRFRRGSRRGGDA